MKKLLYFKAILFLSIISIVSCIGANQGKNESEDLMIFNQVDSDSNFFNCSSIKILSSSFDNNNNKLVLFTDNEIIYSPFGNVKSFESDFLEGRTKKKDTIQDGLKVTTYLLNNSVIKIALDSTIVYANIVDSEIKAFSNIQVGMRKEDFYKTFFQCDKFNSKFGELNEIYFDYGYLSNHISFLFEKQLLKRIELVNYPD